MEEIWKEIEGYNGAYEISSKGNFRVHRKEKVITYKDTILPLGTYQVGPYLYVRLWKNGIKRNFSVKSLMEKYFGENSEN